MAVREFLVCLMRRYTQNGNHDGTLFFADTVLTAVFKNVNISGCNGVYMLLM